VELDDFILNRTRIIKTLLADAFFHFQNEVLVHVRVDTNN